MDHLARRPVNDIRIVHDLQMTQKTFRMKVAVSRRSNVLGLDLCNIEKFVDK